MNENFKENISLILSLCAPMYTILDTWKYKGKNCIRIFRIQGSILTRHMGITTFQRLCTFIRLTRGLVEWRGYHVILIAAWCHLDNCQLRVAGDYSSRHSIQMSFLDWRWLSSGSKTDSSIHSTLLRLNIKTKTRSKDFTKKERKKPSVNIHRNFTEVIGYPNDDT